MDSNWAHRPVLKAGPSPKRLRAAVQVEGTLSSREVGFVDEL